MRKKGGQHCTVLGAANSEAPIVRKPASVIDILVKSEKKGKVGSESLISGKRYARVGLEPEYFSPHLPVKRNGGKREA